MVLKPVDVLRGIHAHIKSTDCVKIVEYIVDNVVINTRTLYTIEKLVKERADFERLKVS